MPTKSKSQPGQTATAGAGHMIADGAGQTPADGAGQKKNPARSYPNGAAGGDAGAAEQLRPALPEFLAGYGTSVEIVIDQLDSLKKLAGAIARKARKRVEQFVIRWWVLDAFDRPITSVYPVAKVGELAVVRGKMSPITAWFQYFFEPIIEPNGPKPPRLKMRKNLTEAEEAALAELELVMAYIVAVAHWESEKPDRSAPGNVNESVDELRQLLGSKSTAIAAADGSPFKSSKWFVENTDISGESLRKAKSDGAPLRVIGGPGKRLYSVPDAKKKWGDDSFHANG